MQYPLAARARKENRYNSLLQDLQQTGLAVDLITIEMGCLGNFKPEAISCVAALWLRLVK